MKNPLFIAILVSMLIHGIFAGVFSSFKQRPCGQKGTTQTIAVLGIVQFHIPETAKPKEIKQDATEELAVELPTEPALATLPLPQAELIPTNAIVELEEIITEPELIEEQPETVVAPPKAPSGKQQLASGDLEDAKTKYLATVINKLEQLKKYPPPAYRRGVQGSAHIEFIIHSDGSATETKLKKSSRHYLLDAEAKKLVDRASPFSPIPTELNQEEMIIAVPITFKINH